ncbi:ATP-dependent helicase [Novipirellula rosea]|uniref:DNA 3'-5' helicase n=1 Tax=Novipirellula rosea TaxID=1031540 RepID=A0ABP8N2Q6_9BACT
MGRCATKKSRIEPQDWRPVGVAGLEEAAEAAVRSEKNSIVVAGPGSGKTELLAQRADYLLRTGICPDPKRILAISFKRDAAKNLRERVADRLPENLAERFDSWTYAAFDKQIVDRFRLAIPECWRPPTDYSIDFYEIGDRTASSIIQREASALGVGPAGYSQIKPIAWFREQFLQRLPVDPSDLAAGSLEDRIVVAAWRRYLSPKRPILSFGMISRLAELLVRANPQLLSALRSTYSHVFLDEFQDTTDLQYDFVRTSFHESKSILTAVGDTKQCIMTWAGALAGVTRQFADEYRAEPHLLRCNFRSEPELIAIIGSLAKQIEPYAVTPIHGLGKQHGEGECRVFEFADDEAEANAIAEVLTQTIEIDGISPRDVCVICRQQVSKYSDSLSTAMRARTAAVQVRDESQLQDLLSEPVVTILLDAFQVATSRTAQPVAWERLQKTLSQTTYGNTDKVVMRRNSLLSTTIEKLAVSLPGCEATGRGVGSQLLEVVKAFGVDAIKLNHEPYRQGDFFKKTLQDLATELLKRYGDKPTQSRDWTHVLSDLMGETSIPIMTIHKSKGLEYHTVVFLGLEDAAFGNLSDPDGEGNNFFVAMSRAKKRVLFTFAKNRFGRTQKRDKVEAFYGWLRVAGVPIEDGSKVKFSSRIWTY